MQDFRLANYFISYVALLLFFAVGAITTLGLGWYGKLALPVAMPAPLVVAVVWCALFVLAALSACAVWDKLPRDRAFSLVITSYAGNALLVLLWDYLFFGMHALFLALLAAALVLVSVVLLIATTWRICRRAALLLLPYLAWMLFATYLMYAVYTLNP